MKSVLQDYKYYLLMVLTLHGLVFTLGFQWQRSKSITFGTQYVSLLRAYVYEVHGVKAVSYKMQRDPLPSKRMTVSLPKVKKITASRRQKGYAESINQQRKGITKPLVKLIYNVIQNNKVTPQNALLMGEKGQVDIAFTITNDGKLDHIQIIKSSGYADLDNAATATIKRSSPIPKAKKYLNHSQRVEVIIHYGSGS